MGSGSIYQIWACIQLNTELNYNRSTIILCLGAHYYTLHSAILLSITQIWVSIINHVKKLIICWFCDKVLPCFSVNLKLFQFKIIVCLQFIHILNVCYLKFYLIFVFQLKTNKKDHCYRIYSFLLILYKYNYFIIFL